MKYRRDYVTNSSSTSYVIARKPELNKEDKEQLLEFLQKVFFGNNVLKPGANKEKIKKYLYDNDIIYSDDETDIMIEKYQKFLEKGDAIYYVSRWIETSDDGIEFDRKFLDCIKEIPTMTILEEQLDY